jgi:hypothetical protein
MAFDLDQLDIVSQANEGSMCVIRHPVTGEEQYQDNGDPVYLMLAGMDSTMYRDAQRKIADSRLNRKSKSAMINLADIEAEQISLLAECTLGWGGMVVAGKELPFDRKTVRSIYEKYPTIREQAEQHVADRSNYLRD